MAKITSEFKNNVLMFFIANRNIYPYPQTDKARD